MYILGIVSKFGSACQSFRAIFGAKGFGGEVFQVRFGMIPVGWVCFLRAVKSFTAYTEWGRDQAGGREG